MEISRFSPPNPCLCQVAEHPKRLIVIGKPGPSEASAGSVTLFLQILDFLTHPRSRSATTGDGFGRGMDVKDAKEVRSEYVYHRVNGRGRVYSGPIQGFKIWQDFFTGEGIYWAEGKGSRLNNWS